MRCERGQPKGAHICLCMACISSSGCIYYICCHHVPPSQPKYATATTELSFSQHCRFIQTECMLFGYMVRSFKRERLVLFLVGCAQFKTVVLFVCRVFWASVYVFLCCCNRTQLITPRKQLLLLSHEVHHSFECCWHTCFFSVLFV